jgi:predicted O-methyltransferase YrrM
MSLHDEAVAAYLRALALKDEDPLLAEMHALALARSFPIVGPEVGRFLAQLVRLLDARRIFELGSGFGYSALWFGRALPEDGELFCTDGDAANIALARDFHARAGIAAKVTYLRGHAQDLLQVTPGLFDIIFCDVDKEQYPEILELLRRHLRVGGAFVIDNLLWDGRVADPEDEEPSTLGVRAFTRRMWDDPEFLSSLLPIRDGVGLSVRLR